MARPASWRRPATVPTELKQVRRHRLDDLSLAVRDGEFCILSGPNGSGKSTLFRILCGMSLPTAGAVRIAGADLLREPAKVRDAMAVVFQSPAVDKHLSVAENLRIHADLYGLRGKAFEARLEEAVGWTDLTDRLPHKVETLSGGMQRQVELAKCMLTRPRLLLLDEPTTGLDPNSRRNFLQALTRLQRERGMTVLMTSHVFSEAEDVDSVAIMRAGVLLAHDTPQALRARLGREMVVVQPTDADALAEKLRREGLLVRRHGDELRLEETENGASLPVLERILARHRAEIVAISIKQPALEDVFIHITTNGETAPKPRIVERTGT